MQFRASLIPSPNFMTSFTILVSSGLLQSFWRCPLGLIPFSAFVLIAAFVISFELFQTLWEVPTIVSSLLGSHLGVWGTPMILSLFTQFSTWLILPIVSQLSVGVWAVYSRARRQNRPPGLTAFYACNSQADCGLSQDTVEILSVMVSVRGILQLDLSLSIVTTLRLQSHTVYFQESLTFRCPFYEVGLPECWLGRWGMLLACVNSQGRDHSSPSVVPCRKWITLLCHL